jgi:acetylornithine deacetylase/succinyl-diaminopimelate desuccinylase-like protein
MNCQGNFANRINAKRLAQRVWELVQIPSPTCREKQVAIAFRQMLSRAGAKTWLDNTIPDSPSVIGRLKGRRPGRTIQLAGHLDHIDIPHPAPKRDKMVISGRGAADMKNGLGGILEIISVLNESDCDFPGEILVTAYGLHEAPTGNSAGLLHLLDSGVKGDAAIVCEGPDDAAAVAANGMAIWEVTITHKEPSSHELCTKANKTELLMATTKLIKTMAKKDRELRARRGQHSLLAPESLFIGQLHCGDFYNRLSNKCFLQGTRRWHPDKRSNHVRDDFERMINTIRPGKNITITNDWKLIGDSYEISHNQPIVRSLRKAYKCVNGKSMRVIGHSSVTDTCRLVRQGGIPAVLCGFGTSTGHADYEYADIAQMMRSARVLMLTVLDFLGDND